MARYLTAYVTTLICIAGLDFLWTQQVGPLVYYPVLRPIMVAQPRLVLGVLFYLIYAAGVVYFAIAPAWTAGRWQAALVRGWLLGVVAYATYDLTNNASLAVWVTQFTVVDMAWGTVLTGVAATVGYLITRRIRH